MALRVSHRLEEFFVCLEFAEAVKQLLKRFGRWRAAERAAHAGDRFEVFWCQQQLLATRSARVDVDGRPEALLGNLAVEDQLGVAGALELLENQLVHPRAGIDQRRGDDRQRAAL